MSTFDLWWNILSCLKCSYLLRKTELTSSWVIGGFLELAAILRGRRKTVTRAESCLTYSSSHSTIPKTILLRLRILSAWSERMYSSTICFHRLRHNHPRKKLCTWKDINMLWLAAYCDDFRDMHFAHHYQNKCGEQNIMLVS